MSDKPTERCECSHFVEQHAGDQGQWYECKVEGCECLAWRPVPAPATAPLKTAGLNCEYCGKLVDSRIGLSLRGPMVCAECFGNRDEIRTKFTLDGKPIDTITLPAPATAPPSEGFPSEQGKHPKNRRDWYPGGQNWNAEVLPVVEPPAPATPEAPAALEPPPPDHPFEVKITIGGETWDYVMRQMEEISDYMDAVGPNGCAMSGGAGGSHSLTIRRRDISPEDFRKELAAWHDALPRRSFQ